VSPLAADVAAAIDAAQHFSVACADDAARLTPRRIAEALAGARTRALAERVLAVCGEWPHGRSPADAATPAAGALPVLILSGGLDPVTPPAYGAEVARAFPNSRHVVAPGYGHIVSPHACAPRMIAAFVDDADTARLPAACVLHFEKSVRPPLWPDRLGGAP
jgi:pimeloyl-ACP methyl ester carboxylesterase